MSALSPESLMDILSCDRDKRNKAQQVAEEVCERMVVEAERFPQDANRLRRAKDAVAKCRQAKEKVEEMQQPDFVHKFMQEHFS